MSCVSDYFNGLYPALLSAVIIFFGYIWQSCLINKQLKSQKQISDNELKEQEKANQNELHLSMQQSLFTAAIEKAKDCNVIWMGLEQHFFKQNPNSWREKLRESLNEKVIDELTISKELLLKAFDLYGRQKNYFSKEEKNDFAYVFWKQLSTDLRDFFVTCAFKYALREGKIAIAKNEEPTYGLMVIRVYNFVKQAMEHSVDKNIIDELSQITGETI
jgi:hypothetical protein